MHVLLMSLRHGSDPSTATTPSQTSLSARQITFLSSSFSSTPFGPAPQFTAYPVNLLECGGSQSEASYLEVESSVLKWFSMDNLPE